MKRLGLIRRAASALMAGVMLAALAHPASAEWRRAESERFIVYSDGSETTLRTFVQQLETYDRVLRLYAGLPMDGVPPRKLPIYTVRNHAGLDAIWPGVPDQIAGYYASSETDIFAVAVRERRDNTTLLHEYAHHFMLQNFAYAYPSWFVEGFAEYYATAEIADRRVVIGQVSDNRAYWIMNGHWMALSDLLSKRPGETGRGEETYYPLSWLLTHWFLSDPERRQQLTAYLTEVAAGTASVEAMQVATGMDLRALRTALKDYTRDPLVGRILTADFPVAQTTVTVLPRSADALLLLGQRLKRDIPDEEKPALIARIRTAASRFPDDPFANLVLARAELLAGDPAAGERILGALLQTEPANVEALQLMASTLMMRADSETDYDTAENLQRRARGFLGRAYAADDANFTTFLMLAESRSTAANYPTDNDIETLRLAQVLAPQLPGARLNLAGALIYQGRSEEAVNLLSVIANDPHNAGLAAIAQGMMEQSRAGSGSQSLLDAAEAAAESPPEAPPPEPEAP